MIDQIASAFEAYYRSFPAHEMHDLKWEHTRRVVACAERIAAGEYFSEAMAQLGLLAAWLHDTGRFKQFQKYQTFSDRVSVNHALMSCAEVLNQGWLDTLSARERHLILQAIEYHNLKQLPEGLDDEEALLAHLVRDADKADIYTVLDEALLRERYLEENPSVYWGLPFRGKPSAIVVDAILAGEPIDYKEIKSFADFIFIQLGWCTAGLHFDTTAKLILERDEVGIRRRFLTQLLPESSAVITRCAQAAESALRARC